MPTSRLRGLVRAYIRTFALSALLYSFAVSCLYGQAAPAPDTKPADVQAQMASAWDQVITSTVPQAAPDPALIPPPSASTKSSDGDFLEHFYFETRTDYQRYQTNFTGNPTKAGVINAPDTSTFNPLGIPSPSAFQPGANRIEELLDFGTRGWLSDRINTHFALRYRQDLTQVDIGSPGENIVEQFYGNKLYEVLDASLEINSKPTDGWFAGSSAELGRINVYGAELASFDGAGITTARRRWAFTLYGGRRFSFFSDPAQRGIGGANLNLKFDPTPRLNSRPSGISGARTRSCSRNVSTIAGFSPLISGPMADLRSISTRPSSTLRETAAIRCAPDSSRSSPTTTIFVRLHERRAKSAANSPLFRLYLGPHQPIPSSIRSPSSVPDEPARRGGRSSFGT